MTTTAMTAATITGAVAPRPYESYVYAYPHKTAYRRLPEPPALRELWADERKDALSLYLHIPFCEVRCGFCNLFTRVGAPDELTTRYLDALDRQATAVRDALAGSDEEHTGTGTSASTGIRTSTGTGAATGTGSDAIRFAAAAFGGGTPTFLDAGELERLCDIAERRTGVDLRAVPLSVETSPATATADRLAVLAERGATRLSLGVQSFTDAEARAAVRPQRRADVEAALGRIRDTRIPVLNIDLIYGIDGQTERTWRHSLDAALAWRPEELYLYPLYIRPHTGLAGRGPADEAPWDAQRLRLYRQGRDLLLAEGYEQVSMRMFRRRGTGTGTGVGADTGTGTDTGTGALPQGPDDYACQTDGMIGLGCGARSYTSRLHYSFDYAVGMGEIRGIIDTYTATRDFSRAEFGHRVDEDEARRRHLLQSLLQARGMEVAGYRERFGSTPGEDFPAELDRFAELGWLDPAAEHGLLRLSPEGLAYSDALGPALFSPAVRTAMAAYETK